MVLIVTYAMNDVNTGNSRTRRRISKTTRSKRWPKKPAAQNMLSKAATEFRGPVDDGLRNSALTKYQATPHVYISAVLGIYITDNAHLLGVSTIFSCLALRQLTLYWGSTAGQRWARCSTIRASRVIAHNRTTKAKTKDH
jgi:hypothetical protein